MGAKGVLGVDVSYYDFKESLFYFSILAAFHRGGVLLDSDIPDCLK